MGNGTVTPEILRALARRQSVLDLVVGGTSNLRGRLGAADQRKLDEHLTLLRELEKNVDKMDPAQPVCMGALDPGPDPATGPDYSGENERLRAFVDLIRMGMACGKIRVGSFMVSHAKCHLTASKAMPGAPVKTGTMPVIDIHGLGHDDLRLNSDWVPKAVAWAIDPFARLVAGLRDTTDETGARLIDNTAMTMCFEGGWTQSGGLSHSVENMMVLYAGAAGGLKPSHVIAKDRHPAEAIRTAMTALGVTGNLGRFGTTIAGMRA